MIKGMSLRDYFAGHALTALASDEDSDPIIAAAAAYEYADAMIYERDKARFEGMDWPESETD